MLTIESSDGGSAKVGGRIGFGKRLTATRYRNLNLISESATIGTRRVRPTLLPLSSRKNPQKNFA
ncbi:MAG: hypothetical protein J0M12_17630, partial [Deltaproteobacteria bacterium]|nr:hypothetical protein [Deltaproteobacteria bacterium]